MPPASLTPPLLLRRLSPLLLNHLPRPSTLSHLPPTPAQRTYHVPRRTSTLVRKPAPQHQFQTRQHTAPASTTKIYDYEEIKTLAAKPDPDRILIDVREPPEHTAGSIPHSLNIPLTSSPDALFLPASEFEERFGFPKPDPRKEVVFYCRSGVRSAAAARFAVESGYARVGEYRGSWVDWERRGGGV